MKKDSVYLNLTTKYIAIQINSTKKIFKLKWKIYSGDPKFLLLGLSQSNLKKNKSIITFDRSWKNIKSMNQAN